MDVQSSAFNCISSHYKIVPRCFHALKIIFLIQALDKCRDSPPMDWPAAAYVLLGREDLAFSCLAYSRKSVELEPHLSVNMTCMSTPYMLNLHPVTIPSSISDTIQSGDNKLEDVDSVAGYVADGMEHIFNSGIQLRYGRDLRLNEVSLLILCMTENRCLQALFVVDTTLPRF